MLTLLVMWQQVMSLIRVDSNQAQLLRMNSDTSDVTKWKQGADCRKYRGKMVQTRDNMVCGAVC